MWRAALWAVLWIWMMASVSHCTDVLGDGESGRREIGKVSQERSSPREPGPEPRNEAPRPSEVLKPRELPGELPRREAPAPREQAPDGRPPTERPAVDRGTPGPRWKLKLLSFNIRYGTAQDGDNHWNKRKDLVFALLRRAKPDLLGLQEAWKFQIDELLQAVPGYKCYGRSRRANTTFDEWSPLCYLESRWKLDAQEQGVLWLSTTPEVPGSQSWESSLPRIVTWARVVEKSSGRGIYLFNTHFDHRSAQARLESAKLLSRRIAGRSMRKEPAILMGDLNASESSPPIRYLKGQQVGGSKSFAPMFDSFRALYPNHSQVGTIHGWSGRKTGSKIDYIFLLQGWPGQRVDAAAILHDNDKGRYPSDHFPVAAEISYP